MAADVNICTYCIGSNGLCLHQVRKQHKFYVDELYDMIVRKPLDALSTFFYKVVEQLGIDGFVNGLGKGTIETSKGLRLLQTGNVGFYIFMMVLGIIGILVYNFLRI